MATFNSDSTATLAPGDLFNNHVDALELGMKAWLISTYGLYSGIYEDDVRKGLTAALDHLSSLVQKLYTPCEEAGLLGADYITHSTLNSLLGVFYLVQTNVEFWGLPEDSDPPDLLSMVEISRIFKQADRHIDKLRDLMRHKLSKKPGIG